MKAASGVFHVLKQVATFLPALDIAKQLINPKTPKVGQVAALSDVADAKAANKTARTAILATDGGINGQELNLGQVGKRDTILGN